MAYIDPMLREETTRSISAPAAHRPMSRLEKIKTLLERDKFVVTDRNDRLWAHVDHITLRRQWFADQMRVRVTLNLQNQPSEAIVSGVTWSSPASLIYTFNNIWSVERSMRKFESFLRRESAAVLEDRRRIESNLPVSVARSTRTTSESPTTVHL